MAAVAQLGDCRVIQVRDGQVLRHTSQDVFRAADGSSYLTKGIGLDAEAECAAWDVRREDTLVLTSIVHAFVSNDELLDACSENRDAEQAPSAMIALALSRGASDDLSVLMLRM